MFEFSYVLVYVSKLVLMLFKDYIMVVNLFGCGDKDIFVVVKYLGFEMKV